MSQILLHIGFAKSGSTYLQRWFEAHPDLYYQPKHIAGGFYHAWELAKKVQHSEKAPENFVLSCEDFSIWKSEPYIYGVRGTKPYNYRKFQDTLCKTLHGLHPSAKVLIVTRGYTTIFKSMYGQYLGMTGTLTFEEMMLDHKDMFAAMLDYTYVINLYRAQFGADNVILLPFELLQKDPVKFLSLIEQGIHLDSKFEFHPNKINAAHPPELLKLYFKLSNLVYRLLKPFPWSWQTGVYQWYMNIMRAETLHRVMMFLSKAIKDKQMNWQGLDEALITYKGKADILKTEDLYQPFLKEYLL
jgi:hypothetical protein